MHAIFFWHAFPYQSFFGHSVHLLFISGMLYLHQLNYAIRRLAFMIPDQTLRQDTELFTGLNRRVLSFLMALGMLYWSMGWFTASGKVNKTAQHCARTNAFAIVLAPCLLLCVHEPPS